MWSGESFSYRGFESSQALTWQYEKLYRRVAKLKADPGISAVVYTQLTDVETEINGLLTYDRAVIKADVYRPVTRSAQPRKNASLQQRRLAEA